MSIANILSFLSPSNELSNARVILGDPVQPYVHYYTYNCVISVFSASARPSKAHLFQEDSPDITDSRDLNPSFTLKGV